MNFNMNWDAQAALGFVVSQTSHIEREVNETVYPDIQYSFLIPVDTSAHPFSKSVTYYSSDKFGAAKWINGNADDIPLAGTERTKHETMVHTAAIGYGYGWEEIGMAQKLGINLPAEDAMAARRAYEEMLDRIFLDGDTEKNFGGLIDNSAVTAANAGVGDWGGTGSTEDTVLADINEGILAVATGTQYASMADTLLLPYTKMNYLATNRLGDTQMTILEFLRRNNTYTAMTGQPLTIRAVRGLETAGVGNTARAVAYRRSPQVLKAHLPMPHRFLQPWQAGPLRIEVPGVFRVGGLDIRRPKEVRYIDGI